MVRFMRSRSFHLGLGVALALSSAAVAHAQTQPSAQDQAAAEGLFSDAKKLMAAGKVAEACPKLEESQRLDPAPGTEFKLAECYEQTGRTASAWAMFLNVAAVAKTANLPDREKIARDRAAALEPKLSKLVIVVNAPPSGITVTRDGVTVGAAQWGSGIAVDPGKHTVTASAPGKQPWKTTVDVGGESTNVTVPPLLDATPEPVAKKTAAPEGGPPPEPTKGFGTQRTLALVAAGVGVVGVGVGSVFGLKDASKLSDAKSHCTGNACDATGVSLRHDAVSAGNVSTIAFGVGLVAMAGAAVLWFTAPKDSSAPPTTGRVVPLLGPSGTGLGGTF